MSRTNIHTTKGKFNNWVLESIPRNLRLHFNRLNFDVAEFMVMRAKIKQKCFDAEWAKELSPYYYDSED
jgi:hypothetical protein